MKLESRDSTMTSSGFGSEHRMTRIREDDVSEVEEEEQQTPKVELDDKWEFSQMEDILARLTEDSELHKMLSDEKMRCEIHRSNYSKLKTEYSKCVHEINIISSDLSRLQLAKDRSEEASRIVQEKLQELNEQLAEENQVLLERIPSEAEKLEAENRIRAESEQRWTTRVSELLEEVEASKLSIQNLLQENLCLKNSMHHLTVDGERLQEELKLKYESKISKLERDNKELRSANEPRLKALTKEVEDIAKENTKLKGKLSYTESLIEEQGALARRNELERSQLLSDNMKAHANLDASSKRLEAERVERELVVRRLNEDLISAKNKNQTLSSTLSEQTAELHALRDRLHDVESSNKMEMSELRMGHAREKSRLVCDVDRLGKQLKDCQSELSSKSDELDRLKSNQEEILAQVRTDCTKTVAEYETRQSELITRIKNLQLHLETCQSEFDRREKELAAILDDERSALARCIKEVGRYKQVNGDLQEAVEALEENVQTARRENRHLRCQLDDTASSEKLGAKVRELEQRLEQERSEHKNQMMKAEEKCEKYSRLISKLKKKSEGRFSDSSQEESGDLQKRYNELLEKQKAFAQLFNKNISSFEDKF